jgi:hypothetical protein
MIERRGTQLRLNHREVALQPRLLGGTIRASAMDALRRLSRGRAIRANVWHPAFARAVATAAASEQRRAEKRHQPVNTSTFNHAPNVQPANTEAQARGGNSNQTVAD